MRATPIFRAALLSAGFALSCASLIGIEDASLDPKGQGGAGAVGGTTSGAGTGPTDAGQGGGEGDPVLSQCARYCDAVMKNCTGPVQVYESPQVCKEVCLQLPPGTPGDRSGNTVACRLFHATQIELIGEEASECPAAGPGGDGVCGENCDGFCTLIRGLCPAALSVECEASCPAIPDQGGYNSSVMGGLSLQCRLYHVSAASLDADFHCPHAAGVGPCAR
jgi:hypothetical protein